jgi:hypothetical protein
LIYATAAAGLAGRLRPNFAASWNVAPTDPLPVVRFDAKDRQRSLAGRSQLTMFAARPRILVVKIKRKIPR